MEKQKKDKEPQQHSQETKKEEATPVKTKVTAKETAQWSLAQPENITTATPSTTSWAGRAFKVLD